MDVLDQLMTEVLPPGLGPAVSGTLSPPQATPQAIQKVSYSHAAMIDMILAQPGISQNALAARFGYTPSWISQVIASDAFQAALAARAKEIIDPVLLLTVNERFDALVRRSQEVLMEKLSKPADVVPDQLAVQVLATSARARGYGARPETPPQAPVDVNIHLNVLGDRLVGLLRRKKTEVIDPQLEAIAGASAES